MLQVCYHVTFASTPLLPVHGSSFNIPQATRAFKDSLSFIYSDPVLHVVLSHQHFVMPFPLRMYYILVTSPPPLQVPSIPRPSRPATPP